MSDDESKQTPVLNENGEPASKSQRKREMQELRQMGEKLVQLTDEQLIPLSNTAIIDALRDCRRITKGNARKRQIQYIGKLLRNIEIDEIRNLIDRYDASSRTHARQFHQLENWREQLISGDFSALDEIAAIYPGLDRQHLKQLTRKAIQEQQKLASDQPNGASIQYRRLFQYLKSLEVAGS
jgi:ribosome-associated protein